MHKAGYTTVFNEYVTVFETASSADPIPIIRGKLVDDLYLVDMHNQACASVSECDMSMTAAESAAIINASKLAWDQSDDEPTIEHMARALVLSCSHLYKHTATVTARQSQNDTATHTQTATCGVSDVWHSRLGHPAKSTAKHMCDACTGIPTFTELESAYALPCQHCLAGRFPASTHHPIGTHPDTPGEMVYCDLTGPYKQSWNGSKFTLNMVDAATGYAYTVCMSEKSDTAHYLEVGIDRMEQLCGRSVQHIRTDCGTEFFNTEVMHMLAQKKILYSTTVPYCPQQNGTVERFNRSVMEICRCLLSDSRRNTTLWPQAYDTATYLYNRRVSTHRSSITRFEAFTGRKPDLSRLKVWGCKCYVRNPNPQNKLEFRGLAAIFVGYDEYSHGYKVKVGKAIYIREDIVFSETELGPNTQVDLTGTPAVPLISTLIPDTTPTAASTDGAHIPTVVSKPIPSPAIDPMDVDTVPMDDIDALLDEHGQEGKGREARLKRKRDQTVPHSPALHTRSHGVNVVGTSVCV
jgi:hypothetical protein